MFGLTMSLALETASKGITVNTVTPGFIGTDMTMAVPADALAKVVARIPAAGSANRTKSPGWWSSWPTPNRPTSPARSTPSTAACTCRDRGTTNRSGKRSPDGHRRAGRA